MMTKTMNVELSEGMVTCDNVLPHLVEMTDGGIHFSESMSF